MVARYELRGIHKVGPYHYAWKGPPLGPRLCGEEGSPEYLASFIEAHENLRAPDNSRFRSLVVTYRSRPDGFERLAPSTKKTWGPWLDRIDEVFGDLRIAQFERPVKIRPVIIAWRNKFAATPRKADTAIQVLSVVLSYAVDPLGKLSTNPCEGIKTLYRVDRSEIIWTEADIAKLKQTCAPELAYAIDLAAHSGLRLGDLLRLSWSHIGDDAIIMPTGKSRGRRKAIIPLYDDLRAVLDRIPKRATTVLTHSQGGPWGSGKSLGNKFTAAKDAAGFADLHFHDLRGTAATKFYIAGLSEDLIADIMGWEREYVSKIIRHYVARGAIIKAAIIQLNKPRT